MPLQIRRGTTANRTSITPLVGELIYDTELKSVFIGDGSRPGGWPVTDMDAATVIDLAAGLLTDNTQHTGITFNQVTVGTDIKLQATVTPNLSNYIGLISADQGFKGNVWADDSGIIVNSETHSVYGNFVPQGHIVPDTNIAYDLGTSTYRFRDIYLSGSSIHLGDAIITSTGTAVDIPTGSTIGGQPLGINEGDTYDITISGNVIGTDSTLLVNSSNGTFHGDLIGSVFADDSTILVDGRDGVLRGSLIGNADTATSATSATVASTVTLVPTNGSTSLHYINFALNSNGDESVRTDTGLTYQPSTNTLATGIVNATTINVTTVSGASNITTSNLFASTIDTADSSAITVVPAITFNADVTVENELNTGSIFPIVSEESVIGSFTKKFSKLYLAEGANALWIGNVAISVSGSTLNLPAGATVGGSPITTSAGSNASTITVNTTGTSADHYIAFFDSQSGDKIIYTDDTFKYNPGTGVLTVGDATIGTVTGNLAGNATSATTASQVTLTADNSTNATNYPLFSDSATGNVSPRTDTGFTYNPSTGTLTSTTFVGALTGNVTSTGTSSFVNITATGSATLATGSFNTSTYSSTTSMFGATQAHSTADARNVTFARARGSITSPTIVSNGDDIADIVFAGYGTSAYVAGAQIMVTVEDATPSNTSMKSRMVLSTNDGTGLVEHVTLDSAGVLTVNTFSSGSIQISENNITGVNSNEDIVIDPSGTGTVDFQIVTQSTVGSAGVASALPATPSTYFKIKLNGVEYVVPAYAVS